MTLRQQLAAIEHERWADWQEYVHSKGKARVIDGEALWCLPMGLVHAWNKQIATPYAELSEREKASDMEQVDRYWPLIERWCQEIAREARLDVKTSVSLTILHRVKAKCINRESPERVQKWAERQIAELTQKPPRKEEL